MADDNEKIKAVLTESIEASLNHISPMAMDFAGQYIPWLIESALYALDQHGYIVVERSARHPHPSAPAPSAAVAKASGAAAGESSV